MINRALMALAYGDMLLKMTNRVRPYEKIKNSTKLLYLKWLYRCKIMYIMEVSRSLKYYKRNDK